MDIIKNLEGMYKCKLQTTIGITCFLFCTKLSDQMIDNEDDGET